MSDNSMEGVPKLSDFGLSVLVGPGQKVKDFCGTVVR